MAARPAARPQPRSLGFALAATVALLAAKDAHGTTPPIDWHLMVNVSPLTEVTHPTSEDRIRVVLRGDQTSGCLGLAFDPPVVTGTLIRFLGHRGGPFFECNPGTWSEEHELPRLPAAASGILLVYTLEVYDEELLIRSQPLEVRGPLRSLAFGFSAGSVNSALVVSVRLTDPAAGAPRDVAAMPWTPTAGYFWFFDPYNVEVTVKVVDGRPVNGHLWVFLTGMSNLGYTVTVRQLACVPYSSCPSKTYVNPPGQQLGVIDSSTF